MLQNFWGMVGMNTGGIKVIVGVMTSETVRRAAPYLLAAALSVGLLATATGAALAKSRKPHAVDLTGFGAVPRIELPALHDPVPPVAVAPARFFTINKVLAKLDGRPTGETRLVSRADRDTLSDAASADATQHGPEPFGLFTFAAPRGLLTEKWRGVSIDIAEDLDALARCRAAADLCSPAATRFLAVIDVAEKLDGRARLDAVNRGVNGAIRYTSDMAQWGVADLWSSPLATFTSGLGDCEDYAIAKYVALREAGVTAADLRIVLARDNALGEDHAVLAARDGGRWLILDNRRADVVEDGDVRHLAPLFAVDQDGVKLFATPFVEHMHHGKDGVVVPAADAATTGGSGVGTLPVLL
jgi:predicted transglutaminase-like cysteine proteinase